MRSPLARLTGARALATAAGLATALVATAGVAMAPAARATGPLPACRYDDILTAPRAYADWSTTLVDTILRVGSGYVPPDLVSTAGAGINGGGQVRKVAIDDLTEMAAAAKANGSPIAVQSAYRSYSQQKTTFDYWVSVDGYKGALKVSARPGHSEHQLGLAIDFRSDAGGPPWEGSDWALSPAGAWMKANAWKYGWVMSYPKNLYSKVCYSYEPWHYRYVGRELAKLVHASKLTVREYLWANFTTATVPPPSSGGSPAPTASVAPSFAPSPTPEPTGTPISTPTAAPTLESTPAASAAPDPSGLPVSSPETFGNAGPVVIAMVVVAVGGLAIGAWLVGRDGRGRRRRTR
jgi:D-alanyl-D-alanine carboxypeptidase